MIAQARVDVPKLALTAAEVAEALGVSERHITPSLLATRFRMRIWGTASYSRWNLSRNSSGANASDFYRLGSMKPPNCQGRLRKQGWPVG